MGKLEKILLSDYHLKPLIWLWFIDGTFFVWTHGKEAFDRFVEYANSAHHTIKFTCNKSKSHVEFLDTRVIIDPQSNELYITLYTKTTDTRDVLHFTSAHP